MKHSIRESYDDGGGYFWLPIQHVGVPINVIAPSLLPMTIVARVNYRASRNDGDYAAYIGAGLPTHSTDNARVAYIAAHGNKVEGELAELLFRDYLDEVYGAGVIRYRR